MEQPYEEKSPRRRSYFWGCFADIGRSPIDKSRLLQRGTFKQGIRSLKRMGRGAGPSKNLPMSPPRQGGGVNHLRRILNARRRETRWGRDA